ncbi:MAG: hypothetical protein EOP87_04755 [Verrucomicrobiaceae bacterium]|nr:MAG: hypothetical protein EOP87_04755 [Verrucomicrobiaceae bacterium]
MKPKALLLPLVAIIAAAFLLISQSRAISSAREQEALLRKQIAGANGDSPSPPATDAASNRKHTTPKGFVNWLRLAELTGQYNPGGIFATQERKRAEKRIQAMSQAELLAALEQVKSLDLDTSALFKIVELLFTELGKKDPEAAAKLLIDPGNDHIILSGILKGSILANWAKRDLPGALAWFDQEIAAGSFTSKSLDGSNGQRLSFEAAFLARLSLSDPETAVQRLAAYPPEERSAIFIVITQSDRYITGTTDVTELASRVALARGGLSAEQQAKIISDSIGSFAGAGDYGKVADFLEQVAATPEERASSVAAAAGERFQNLGRKGTLTTAEVDRFREWATGQTPEKVDEFTGRALAVVAADRRTATDRLAGISELLSHYQESSGNDDVLLGFLGTWYYWGNVEKARSLAEQIHDPERRARFLGSLSTDVRSP